MKDIYSWKFPDSESHMDRMIGKSVKKFGRADYQFPVREKAVLKYCHAHRVALDIGAHVGLWSKPLAEQFQQVISFEPVQKFRECFVENVKAPNVVLHPIALGDRECKVAMFVNPENTGNTHINLDEAITSNIPMKTVDSFEFPVVDFMKIDVEGYEIFVLQGSRETIARCKPTIVIEQKPHTFYGLSQYAARDFAIKSLGMRLLEQVKDDFILGF